MHQNPNERLRDFDVMERETVYLLTDPGHYPAIWSAADIGRELETSDPCAVLRPLVSAGLVNCTSDGYVFATPAAFRMVQMVGKVV